ncbi:MAG TPA: prolyl oligopeptidase family serine peptidase [Bryobacteraceae bacterium]|nr:prolyl oligopeptidase family serine peptidase [Bryobacteraceae bacterium]
MAIALGAFLLAGGWFTPAPAEGRFALTIDNIMRGPQLYGYEPTRVRWSGDSNRIYFQWKQASDAPEKPPDTYVVNRDSSGLRKLSDEDARLAPPGLPYVAGRYTRDRSRIVWAADGDLFLYDFRTDKGRQLTRTADAESNPQFTLDETRVAFMRGGNLYTLSLGDGVVEQWTEIQPPGSGAGGGSGGPAGSGAPPEDKSRALSNQEFLKQQETELIEAVRDRAKLKEEEDARRKKIHPRKPFELTGRQTAQRLQLCPDETCVIALVADRPADAKREPVPNYVTESAYVEEINGRANVGDSQARDRIAVLNATTGEAKWVEMSLGNRDVRIESIEFNPQGTRAVVLATASDNKDAWIMALDPAAAMTKVLFQEHDEAWVNGPQSLGWMKDGESVYFVSERDGYFQLYTLAAKGGDSPRQLTSGTFEISDVDLSRDGSTFYLTTSEANAGERRLYSMKATGGERTEITRDPGAHRAVPSPDGKYLADVYSYTNKPPELYAAENRPGAARVKLTDSPAKEFWEYPWLDAPVVQMPARDGARIPARFYKPSNYRAGGPAVVFVHGAGYLQNAHKYWSSYSHEYLFHHFLMEHGYMVLDMDYRGSAGYGRDWRTAIYRHMGGTDLNDNVDGAKWLVAQGADPKRIGIYGGSYGGFITLMAMFTTPDVFAAGAALRPVTDWAHYNNGYTSNILNVPQKDAEAYKQSSPIYFAEGLKGALLICHGMVDTNVFFQDTVRLTERLIELHKENWSVAMYPVEDHGFVRAASWADEYKRIFNLFEANLKK